jgi:dienelactone hydrolase
MRRISKRRHWLTLVGVFLLATRVTPAQSPAGKLSGEGVTTDVVYGHKAGMALTFDIYAPERPNGAAVISIVSGGWRSSWDTLKQFRQLPSGSFRLLTAEEIDQAEGILPSHSYRNLMQKGYTVFAVRHGSSPNFNMPEIVGDVRRAVRFIRAHAHGWSIDPDRIGLWGGSAGGHLSLLVATTSEIGNPKPADDYDRGPAKLAAVVAYAPPTDLPAITEFWMQNKQSFPAVLDLNPAERKEYSPIQYVSRDDPPALIVHGDQDKTVPYMQGKSMHDALMKEGVASKLLTVEGAGHGFFGPNANRVNLEMVAWFEKYLQQR